METLFSIITALQPQEWITKIDLKDAYHYIPVHINIRKYFCFVIAGKPYQFRVLPFGLSTAPCDFTKTLAPVVQLLRYQGIRVHAYLDDWIIRADSPDQSRQHTRKTISLLQSLGWTINWKKPMLTPSLIIDLLGLHFNLAKAIISPPESFLASLTQLLSRLSTSTVTPIRKLSSITSRISHIAPFIHHGTPATQVSPVLDQVTLDPTQAVLGHSITTGCRISILSALVQQTGCSQGTSFTSTRTQPVLFHRRFRHRLGSQLARSSPLRTMVSTGFQSAHQLARTRSHPPCSPQVGTSLLRQQYGSSLYTQAERNPFQVAFQQNTGNISLSGQFWNSTHPNSSSRSQECNS